MYSRHSDHICWYSLGTQVPLNTDLFYITYIYIQKNCPGIYIFWRWKYFLPILEVWYEGSSAICGITRYRNPQWSNTGSVQSQLSKLRKKSMQFLLSMWFSYSVFDSALNTDDSIPLSVSRSCHLNQEPQPSAYVNSCSPGPSQAVETPAPQTVTQPS